MHFLIPLATSKTDVKRNYLLLWLISTYILLQTWHYYLSFNSSRYGYRLKAFTFRAVSICSSFMRIFGVSSNYHLYTDSFSFFFIYREGGCSSSSNCYTLSLSGSTKKTKRFQDGHFIYRGQKHESIPALLEAFKAVQLKSKKNL